jgi:SAM-dependent methyltransferase
MKYAPEILLNNFSKSRLSNICGVGIFILTPDKKVIISKHSRNVSVLPDVWSYTASGTMDWNKDIHPFNEVIRECHEEVGENIDVDDLHLFQIGQDIKKMYYQFSFFAEYSGSVADLISRATGARDYSLEMETLEEIDLDPKILIPQIRERNWEPAAAAALVTLSTKFFGYESVESIIDTELINGNFRRSMKIEWNQRAKRPGDYAVMSARYPSNKLEDVSNDYVTNVLEFLGDDIKNKRILEIGPGIGRITKHLIKQATTLTCIDLSDEMIKRNKANLGKYASKVKYIQKFAQDLDIDPENKYDLVISSLVLIHNVRDNDYNDLVQKMCSCSDTIFIFEHCDNWSMNSNATRIRNRNELLSSFSDFQCVKEQSYLLFNDNILFAKLTRIKQQLLRLVVLHIESGFPLFTYDWPAANGFSEETLFSGMLAGLNGILQEAMHKGTLEELRLNMAALLVEKNEEYHIACVLVATKGDQEIRAALKTFAEKFHNSYSQYYDDVSCTGNFESAESIVKECFVTPEGAPVDE